MSFLSPYFLFGLLAMALPILYHFVRKMKAKEVKFSSLMFLSATPKELVKRRRLRDILLMTLRAAIFGLLALIFARPFIAEDKLPFLSSDESQSVVLLVDHSLSMQYEGVFERLKESALEQIDSQSDDNELSLLIFSDEATQVTPLSDDFSLARNYINSNLEASYRATDFYQALRLGSEILQDAKYEQRRIIMLSDFQMSGWPGAIENWKLDPEIAFTPIQVMGESLENDFVEELQITQKRKGEEVAVRVDARLNLSKNSTSTLEIDGSSMGTKSLTSGEARRVNFQHLAPRTGIFQGSMKSDADALLADNDYFFTYPVTPRPSILVIDENRRQALSDAFFLTQVFDQGESSLYQIRSAGNEMINARAMRDQSVVFLSNPAQFGSARLRILRDYVEQGGSLVISLGDRVNVNSLSAATNELGLGDAKVTISARQVQSSEAIIGDIDFRHPIFQIFGDAGGGAILRPKFRRYVQVEENEESKVLARFDTGDPALIERSLGQGRVLLYTTSLNTAWNDFPINESFLPFLYQLVDYGSTIADRQIQYLVGDVIEMPLRSAADDRIWEVSDPQNNVYKVTPDSLGIAYFRESNLPGNYLAAHGSSSFAFSVNLDPRESDLSVRDEEEVYAAVVPPAQDVVRSPEQTAALNLQGEERNQKFWKFLLLLALILFAIETVLANRIFGSNRLRANRK